MDAKSFWHLNSHKYKTHWIANANDDKIIFEKSDDLWRYMNDFLEQSHKPVVVWGGGKDDNLSTIERTMLTTPLEEVTPNTPTEPLPAEGQGTVAAGWLEMCGSDCCPDDGRCEHCQNPITDERKSSEGQP
jgi:hypothetical protein